jgi:hypothetical protein
MSPQEVFRIVGKFVYRMIFIRWGYKIKIQLIWLSSFFNKGLMDKIKKWRITHVILLSLSLFLKILLFKQNIGITLKYTGYNIVIKHFWSIE